MVMMMVMVYGYHGGDDVSCWCLMVMMLFACLLVCVVAVVL